MNSGFSEYIKAEAKRLGFFACGIARAEPVDEETAAHLRRWLSCGGNAGMAYMANHIDMRLDPRLLMPDVKSIVSVALNYTPSQRPPEGEYQFAAYALGSDYHEVMKSKLRCLASSVVSSGVESRIFCDTAPVLERYWAVRAGLGWTGRNHQLIIPGAGSMFFLGELFLSIEVDYDEPMPSRCGNCRRCIDACPTHALSSDSELDANHCISYQTIENRGAIPPAIAAAMGDTVYGCDRCQTSCPWNRFARPNNEPLLQPRQELLSMRRADWHCLSIEDYRRLFKGSAVKRVKYEGLMRNIRAVNDSGED